jgi:hypothetical protein
MTTSLPRPPALEAPNGTWIIVELGRRTIEEHAFGAITSKLSALVADRHAIESSAGAAMLSVSGYDDDPRELCEIPEVRAAFNELTRLCPWWLHLIRPDCDAAILSWFVCRTPVAVKRRSDGQVFVEFQDTGHLNDLIRLAVTGMSELHRRHGLPAAWTLRRIEAITEAIRATL